MKQKLLDYIRHLSKQDKKTLSQKVLKVGEEFGELARVALPFDSAYATNHRFVERTAILEEAVDTMLTSLSVAYDLDFTDQEIEDMIALKTEKWAGLQAKESTLKYPIPFEIHITVDLSSTKHPISGAAMFKTIDDFRTKCAEFEVKPIILDLQNTTGATVMKDVMTSSKHFGTNRSAYAEADLIARKFQMHGFTVVRTKIETVPWHPAAPQKDGDVMPTGCYFEAHVPAIVTDDTVNVLRDHITEAEDAFDLSVHQSRNVFKSNGDGSYVVMLTIRQYDTIADTFVRRVENFQSYLKHACGFETGKTHTEFAVYDTKVHHDSTWIDR